MKIIYLTRGRGGPGRLGPARRARAAARLPTASTSSRFARTSMSSPAPAATSSMQTGPEGVILVDSGSTAMADKVLATIRRVTPLPIRYIINTSHGRRSRRWERQARQGGAQHPPGRCRGRRGVERRPGLQLGPGQRAGTRKRADQDDVLNGSAGLPVRALAHEDIRLQAVLDVPERRRHSGDSHARGAHRWRHDRVLPPWRCDCDGRHHRHDPLARHRHQARRHRPGRDRCTEPPDGS